VALFGGAVRDIAFNGADAMPKDLDLVIADAEFERIADHIDPLRAMRNSFGGLKIVRSGWRLDIWPITKTWAFVESPTLFANDFCDLPFTTVLSTEAIAVEIDLTNGDVAHVHEHGFFESIENRTVDLNHSVVPDLLSAAVRSIHWAARLRFDIAPRAASLILEAVSIYGRHEIQDLLARHEQVSQQHIYLTNQLIDRCIAASGRRSIRVPTAIDSCQFTLF
jgi:hypothetical protein